MVTELTGRACAKINLFLRVTGRRGDGYHELDSVFLPISLADEIRLEIRAADESSVTVNCNLPELARSRNNLAARAARSFMSEFDLVADVSIDLEKRIPVGAGLGGGSSDAATILCMMAAAARLTDDEAAGRLRRLALSLGADVPFFLDPQPSRVTGIGERIVGHRRRARYPDRHRRAAVRGFDRRDLSRARTRRMERRGARRSHRIYPARRHLGRRDGKRSGGGRDCAISGDSPP